MANDQWHLDPVRNRHKDFAQNRTGEVQCPELPWITRARLTRGLQQTAQDCLLIVLENYLSPLERFDSKYTLNCFE